MFATLGAAASFRAIGLTVSPRQLFGGFEIAPSLRLQRVEPKRVQVRKRGMLGREI
jgi:hypothetical protein